MLAGFRAVPVFRIEDTEGAPVVREQLRVNIPCEFSGIIQELGLSVKPVRFCGSYYGSYNLASKEIHLDLPVVMEKIRALSYVGAEVLVY